MNLARIVEGATAGSTLVQVALTAPNGTTVVVHRGELEIGSGEIAVGLAQVNLSISLSTDDVIQASVEEKGNACGSPVIVAETGIRLTGWATPDTVSVENPDGSTSTYTAEDFKDLYGYLPASLYDRAGVGSVVTPEWEQPQYSPILFDVQIERQSNQTTVTVQNVLFARGGILTQWDGVGGWTNALSHVYEAPGTYLVKVRGSDDPEKGAAKKALLINVVVIPTAPVPDERIKYYSWRNFGNGVIRVNANSKNSLEARINGSLWEELKTYASQYWEGTFFEVPDGSSQIDIRVSGETDANKWVIMNFVTNE